MNEFEQRLRRVPVKPIPAGWRAEILAAAVPARPATGRGSWAGRLNGRWHDLLWPHPKAWAGLAAAWLVILLLQVSQQEGTPARAAKFAPPSPEMLVELRQQQQMLVELLGPFELRDADRVRTVAPRTQRGLILMG
jgi:hypothetical protein